MTISRTFAPTLLARLFVGFVAGLLVAGLAGCGKASDLPAMQEEANGIVRNYAPRFEDLARRAEGLNQRGNALGVSRADAATAGQLFMKATQQLTEMRDLVASAPGAINTAAATGKKDELAKLMSSLAIRFGNGWTEIKASLDAVESWIENAERLGRGELPPPADPVPTTPPGPATPPITTGAPRGTGPATGVPAPAPTR